MTLPCKKKEPNKNTQNKSTFYSYPSLPKGQQTSLSHSVENVFTTCTNSSWIILCRFPLTLLVLPMSLQLPITYIPGMISIPVMLHQMLTAHSNSMAVATPSLHTFVKQIHNRLSQYETTPAIESVPAVCTATPHANQPLNFFGGNKCIDVYYCLCSMWMLGEGLHCIFGSRQQ